MSAMSDRPIARLIVGLCSISLALHFSLESAGAFEPLNTGYSQASGSIDTHEEDHFLTHLNVSAEAAAGRGSGPPLLVWFGAPPLLVPLLTPPRSL
jgi:hypothetical protein